MTAKRFLSTLLTLCLAAFTLRRWVFTIAALGQGRPLPTSTDPQSPTFLVIVPLRNEESRLPGLLRHLGCLDTAPYHHVLFVDDGSSDRTAQIVRSWCHGRKWAAVLQIPVAVGKAEALRRALAHEKYGELVAVFDADERPAPDVLSSFAAAFSDLRIGGVSGLRAVSNPLAGPAASYSTFETLVHQWITMRAKDRLGLQPASLGSNCAYRRSALEQVGGFTSGLYLEDSEITIRLAQAGWRTRFIPQAFSTHRVPSTLEAYWVQHVRWAQGFQQVNRLRMAEIMADRHLPGALRLELAAFSSGYLDRLFVLITAGFHLVSRPPRFLTSIFAAYLLTPLLQVIAALRISGAPVAFYRKLPILPLFFVIDIAAAFVGFIRSFNKSRGIWRSDLAQGS